MAKTTSEKIAKLVRKKKTFTVSQTPNTTVIEKRSKKTFPKSKKKASDRFFSSREDALTALFGLALITLGGILFSNKNEGDFKDTKTKINKYLEKTKCSK